MSTLTNASSPAMHSQASLEPATEVSFLSDLMALAKVRLTGMVVITTMVGFWLGGGQRIRLVAADMGGDGNVVCRGKRGYVESAF